MTLTLFVTNRSPSLTDVVRSGTPDPLTGVKPPQDLTGLSVQFMMREEDTAVIKVNSPATITSAVDGEIQYNWDAADVDTAGNFIGWWRITSAPGVWQDSDEFQIVIRDHDAQPLTIEMVRQHVETGMSDDALQVLIDANVADVEDRFGTDGQVTERFMPGYGRRTIRLAQPAATVTTVTESNGNQVFLRTLDPTLPGDYVVLNGGRTLRRLIGGTWGSWEGYWAPIVDVTYIPQTHRALRERVIIALIKLDVNYSGLQVNVVGDTTENMMGNKGSTIYTLERAQIMSQLGRRGLRFA